jgi:hypothetical protein
MTRPSNTRVIALLFIWLAAASAAGASGRVAALQPPLPQLIVIGLAMILLALERWTVWLREWVAATDTRAFVALHITRFAVGVVFLEMGRQGRLPTAFSAPAGWGDVVVGIFAGWLVLGGGVTSPARHKLYHAWNLVGLIDLLLVIANAARLAMAAPDAMAGLLDFPMSVVPTVLVPILLATHAWIFLKLGTEPDTERRGL